MVAHTSQMGKLVWGLSDAAKQQKPPSVQTPHVYDTAQISQGQV